jgi:hypothetical protein
VMENFIASNISIFDARFFQMSPIGLWASAASCCSSAGPKTYRDSYMLDYINRSQSFCRCRQDGRHSREHELSYHCIIKFALLAIGRPYSCELSAW